jgi:hypothetical protein
MNLKGRYEMLRQASLQMVGLPSDDLDDLKKLAVMLQVPALTDADAAVSLLVLQTLITTHAGNNSACVRCRSTEWATMSSSAGVMKQCSKCGNARFPKPGEKT